ncbi:MAG TPA: hypothetical protein VK920_05365 [Solirubrobacterales bacterium]|nr:hypothetical protein [Solirubrobacterales bacterium]
MREVSDGFLLLMDRGLRGALGLFLVGIFFFVEMGFHRLDDPRRIVEPYFGAGTRIVMSTFDLARSENSG